MIYFDWDDEDDVRGNTRHVLDTGISCQEFESVACDANSLEVSRHPNSSGETRWIAYGYADDGRYIAVVHLREEDDDFLMIRPVTAFFPDEDQGS